MEILNFISQHLAYAFQKLLGNWLIVWWEATRIWLIVWAIRHKAGIDYKLSGQARTVRWAIVAACFALTSVPGERIGWFRVFGGLVGIGFLCWPNLAYYLNSLFERWPAAEARVESVQQQSASRWLLAYDFRVEGQRYGGYAKVSCDRSNPGDGYREGMRITIHYDPLNPDLSSRLGAKTAHSPAAGGH